MGLSNQSLVAYAKTGRVPYEHIGPISRALGHLSVWGFDYAGLLNLQGSGPAWTDVVNSYDLSDTDKAFILQGATPKETL